MNATGTPGVPHARELTVQVLDQAGELAAGMSGWTWGIAAGIGLTWVRDDFRAEGLGSRVLREIFRWEGVPTPDHADVHFRKDL